MQKEKSVNWVRFSRLRDANCYCRGDGVGLRQFLILELETRACVRLLHPRPKFLRHNCNLRCLNYYLFNKDRFGIVIAFDMHGGNFIF
jgi:hypothetical protein